MNRYAFVHTSETSEMTQPLNRKLNLIKIITELSRFEIITALIDCDENLCVKEVAMKLQMLPSAVSHQMAKLEILNIVAPIRNGKMVCYKLADTEEAKLVLKIKNLVNETNR